ncbi:hypothetical protein L249_3080 [Ophiocordyceps polyrhachis-furcata BCC 54312]|uniref:F-box domain-containing protein n=1 Tax=Ophiocordyceps polyrhachis-furcata BCC 54312 TaxID=1330021 RepID=A0A367LNY6_9HYPO|nr:hypothetical protein L249_3080 [Ophiocordyceps polyrhachis-furcata BCC 54312]
MPLSQQQQQAMSKDPTSSALYNPDNGQLIMQNMAASPAAWHLVAHPSLLLNDDDDDDDDNDDASPCLQAMPNEILLNILGFLDVNDLLSTSRVRRTLASSLCLSPVLHLYRLRRSRVLLPPLLANPGRPSLADLMARSIFLTHTSIVSRRLARSLVSIRLSRRLAARPSAEALVQRAVLPKECVPGLSPVLVSPAIVARRKAIEKERLKDGLRRWIASKWTGEVREREEDVRRSEESRGVGRVWRLTRFWERIGRGDHLTAR